MRLNTRSRYAIMALADLAHQPERKNISLKDLSLRQGLSQIYLEQLFAALRRGGIVSSTRGARGIQAIARSCRYFFGIHCESS